MIELPFHHCAVAVASLEQAIPLYTAITGATPSPTEELASQGVRVVFVGQLELLEPLSPDTTVGRFLERHGPGLHHLAYQTSDIEGDLARLASQGYRLVDAHARPGAFGHQVAFLHPASTGHVLIELVQEHA